MTKRSTYLLRPNAASGPSTLYIVVLQVYYTLPLTKPQHEHILNPVTALEFYQKPDGPLLILAGEGSFLKIFEAETSRLLSQCELFNGQAIHGIVVTESTREGDLQALVWGGAWLTLLKKCEFEQLLTQDVTSIAQGALEASDWILDAAFSPLDPSCCILITAHNTILRASFDKASSQIVLETLASPSRSILYSAHLVFEDSREILVAAGTVFGEIIVWQCSVSGAAEVLFTFTGHEGSIFGVNISPPINYSDKRQSRLLASCSDDRTIRVWDLALSSTTRTLEDNKLVVRETGFGQNNGCEIRKEGRCVATVMAHASRIWRVKFLYGQEFRGKFTSINLLSFGEDSTTQQWYLEHISSSTEADTGANSTAKPSRLVHMKTFAFHSGKHIWSAAVHHVKGVRAILATGGADGKISLHRLETTCEIFFLSSECDNGSELWHNTLNALDEIAQSSSWDLEEILRHFPSSQPASEATPVCSGLEGPGVEPSQLEVVYPKPSKKKKAKPIVKDAFNRYTFVSENQLLLITTFGRVLLGTFKINGSIVWEETILPDSASLDLKSYSLAIGFPELGLAYLAGANGKIYTYQGGLRLFGFGNVEGKVADMFKIFDPRTHKFELLVTTLAGKEATLFSINLSGTELPSWSGRFEYRLPEKFVVTSAGKIDHLLILGSRFGSLIAYDHKKSGVPLSTWKSKASPMGDAITTIISLPTGRVSELSYFLTTGRDGVYSIFTATALHDSSMNISNVSISCVHVGSLPFGPMIEAAWFDKGDLLFYGFKSKNFVVWNESKQLEIINVECGGAHRSYAYSSFQESIGGHFVYTKASKLYVHSQQTPSHMIVKRGGHGREIKACAVSADGAFIATGAEDTAIRIWQYKDGTSFLENQ